LSGFLFAALAALAPLARSEMAAMLEQSTKSAVGARRSPHQHFVEYLMLKPLLVASAFVVVFSSIQADARPQHRHHHGHRAWCGSYLSKYLGKPDRRLALARSWASEGMNAGGPGIGVVVVWPHHVGIITGQTPDGQWIVHSGNDGGAVRTRARSLARAIAFRRV